MDRIVLRFLWLLVGLVLAALASPSGASAQVFNRRGVLTSHDGGLWVWISTSGGSGTPYRLANGVVKPAYVRAGDSVAYSLESGLVRRLEAILPPSPVQVEAAGLVIALEGNQGISISVNGDAGTAYRIGSGVVMPVDLAVNDSVEFMAYGGVVDAIDKIRYPTYMGAWGDSVRAATAALLEAGDGPVIFRFADLDWGLSRQSVRSRLRAKGYRFTRADSQGDDEFTARIMGRDAKVFAMYDRAGELVKVFVAVQRTPLETQRSLFQDMLSALVDEYGVQDESNVDAQYPYSRSEPWSDTGLSLGKIKHEYNWHGDDIGSNLVLGTSTNYGVYVSYESTAWDREYLRRSRRSDL